MGAAEDFARAWADVLEETSFVALGRQELEQLTLRLADLIAAAVLDDSSGGRITGRGSRSDRRSWTPASPAPRRWTGP